MRGKTIFIISVVLMLVGGLTVYIGFYHSLHKTLFVVGTILLLISIILIVMALVMGGIEMYRNHTYHWWWALSLLLLIMYIFLFLKIELYIEQLFE